MWLLPLLILSTTVLLSVPVGRYLAWLMDGKYKPATPLRWFERQLDTGPQSWKQYAISLVLFNTVMFVFGYLILALQPQMPLNQKDSVFADGKGMLSPTTIFNTATSFLTNTNLQHYSGEQHFSYFTQLVFVVWNMFTSAAVGFCVLAAVIRGLRGDAHMGNFYLDMWRIVVRVESTERRYRLRFRTPHSEFRTRTSRFHRFARRRCCGRRCRPNDSRRRRDRRGSRQRR